jgi:hypothetical protein
LKNSKNAYAAICRPIAIKRKALNLPKKLARTLGFPKFLRYEFLKKKKKSHPTKIRPKIVS